jgi:adenylate kinase
MFETVYLTGASATGKSTLSRALTHDPSFAVFEYDTELLKSASAESSHLTLADIRSRSEEVVLAAHIAEVDEALQRFAAKHRTESHVVIESSAVTKEPYGFRGMPFAHGQLERVAISRIVVLQCTPEVLIARIQRQPEGRPTLDLWEAAKFLNLQESTAITYSTMLGIPIHFLNSDVDLGTLLSTFVEILWSADH